MKKLTLLLCLLLPVVSIAEDTDKNDCEQMYAEGQKFLEDGDLQFALNKFLDALTCNPRKGDSAKKRIREVFDKIEDQRQRLFDLNQKNENLLALFFDDRGAKKKDWKNAAWALGPNGKYAVINRDGEVKGDKFVWSEPQPFVNKRAIAKKGGEYFFIDEQGLVMSEEGFDFLHPTTTPHYFGIQELKNMVRESVLDGEEGSRMERIRMLKEGFDRASEDYFPFKKNFYWKLMRSDGSVLPGNFDTLSKVYEGYAAACQNGKWGLIDTAGNAEKYGGFIYDSVGNFADKIAWTLKDNEYRLIFAEDERAKHEASGPTLIQAYESYFNSHIDSGIFKVDSVKKTTKSINPFLGALSFLSIGNFTIIERKGKADFLSLFQERELYGLNYRDTTLIEPNFDLITHQDSVVYVVQKRSHKGMKIFGDAVSAKKKGAIRGDEADEPDEAVTPMGHSVKLVHQLDPDYEELGRFQRSFTNKGEESYVRIKLDGKWGYAFWNKGEQYPYRIIKPQYDLATDFFKRNGQEVALVYIEKYNLYFYINRAGQMLTRIERNKIW